MEVTDGHERTVTKKWDGNHNDRLVEDDGQSSMDVGDEDLWKGDDG